MINLNEKILVLNRVWQAIDTVDTQTGLCDVFRGVATAIDTREMRPVRWDEWMTLPVQEGDRVIQTIHGPIRVPTVICKSSYAQMPKRVPNLDRRGVGERDNYTCQATGKYCPDGTLDHVVARSKGGKHAWENIVWMDKKLNHRKGNRSLSEIGLVLRRKPFKPKPIPACARIRPLHEDWKPFLVGR